MNCVFWVNSQKKLNNLRPLKASNQFGGKKGKLGGLWLDKYNSKKQHAKNKNIEFNLSFSTYLYLVYKAGIKNPKLITNKGNTEKIFHLGRHKDQGPYSLKNCRFISMKKNLQEMNLYNGNKKRVKQGVHHFLGKLPWDSFSATEASLEVWRNADKCYDWWLKNKAGCIKLQNNFRFTPTRACRNIIKKFKEGWNPNNDKNWIKWKKKILKEVI